MRLPSALILSLVALTLVVVPVRADDSGVNVEIEDNGSKSVNGVFVGVFTGTKVEQSNVTYTENVIEVVQNTGDNDIKGTTGGSSSIDTGKTKTEISVVNQSGTNTAQAEPCGCEPPQVDANIKDNGYKSFNHATVMVKSKNKLSQTNVTQTGNLIGVVQNTGGNDIKGTTSKWWGGSYLSTGKTTAKISVLNQSGANTTF